MIDIEKRIIGLIKQGKNNREICHKLNIDNMTLRDALLDLKTKGLDFDKRYLLICHCWY